VAVTIELVEAATGSTFLVKQRAVQGPVYKDS